jgi:hypothetical protein
MVNCMRLFARSLAPFCRGVLLAAAALLVLTPGAEAKKRPEANYDLSGNVLSYDHDGQIYRVATDRLVFTMTCDKVKKIQFHDPQCSVNGRPIVVGDTVRFRMNGDQAYLPPMSGSMEQELQILFTELKTPPEMPGPSADGVVRGVVLGEGQTFWARSEYVVGNAVISGRPVWSCEMQIVAGGKAYRLDCPSNPCQVNDQDVEPGATFAIRVENNTAWLSVDNVHFRKDDKFKVLGVSNYAPPQGTASATK